MFRVFFPTGAWLYQQGDTELSFFGETPDASKATLFDSEFRARQAARLYLLSESDFGYGLEAL